MADKVYKSPLDMAEGEWDNVLGKATSHSDGKQAAQYGRVNFNNKDEFLRKHGLDKYYEFDGGDLWDLSDDENGGLTTIRVGYGDPSWDEEKLLTEIEKLGRWKRGQAPAPAAAAPLFGSKSKFAQKYPDRFNKLKTYNVYGKGRTAEDVDWDFIAKTLGIDID